MVEEGSKPKWDAIPATDERSDINSMCTQNTNKSRFSPEKKIFLPYGVGPIIDCEIDDDSDEPDYLSYTLQPEVDLAEDGSIPGDEMS